MNNFPVPHTTFEIERAETLVPIGRKERRATAWRWIAGRKFRDTRWN